MRIYAYSSAVLGIFLQQIVNPCRKQQAARYFRKLATDDDQLSDEALANHRLIGRIRMRMLKINLRSGVYKNSG